MAFNNGFFAVLVAGLVACQLPDDPEQQVGYRNGSDGTDNGERGTVKITEILWSGSVTDDGRWDPTDVFVEIRNEGMRDLNLSGWRFNLRGPIATGWRIPDTDKVVEVGQEFYIAAKSSGCFPEPDAIIPDMRFPFDEGFDLTLLDPDERLLETAGDDDLPAFVGGYDFVSSRSMERIQLMFGGDANKPQSWHFYAKQACSNAVIDADPTANRGLLCFQDKPNNDRVRVDCRAHTLASPGRPNSADYSGAFASGSFE